MTQAEYIYGKLIEELPTTESKLLAGEQLLTELTKEMYNPDKLRIAMVAKAINKNNKIMKGGI